MLRQNSDLRPHRIWNWTIPAWFVVLASGERFYTCPNAGVCAQYCYARNGTYRFRNVLAAHTANLTRVLDDRHGWAADMIEHLRMKRYRPNGVARSLPMDLDDVDPTMHGWIVNGGAAVRIHDSGDFFAEWYRDLWAEIATTVPDVLFYAYTKEVEMFRDYDTPPNMRVLYSTGGLQDHLIDPDTDRHADVFPDEAAITLAGYSSQDASDLLAVLLPTTRIGIPANRIPHFNRKLAGRRFSEAVPVHLRMAATP